MGSPSDAETAKAVRTKLCDLGVPCVMRVTSAHKGTEETLRILAEYEGRLFSVAFCNSFLFGDNLQNL